MPTPFPISVLDTSPVVAGSTPAQALRNTLDLAHHAERLGYHRYWLAEHHNMPGIASAATAVLIGQVAAATSTMRVGSGGIMLPNHAPLVVAEQFGTLESLFPGRIDLGLGRAPGTDRLTASALRRSPGVATGDEFPGELGELLAFFRGSFPASHPFSRITAVPGQGAMPPIWLLGSSDYSARLAGVLGMPFAFAHHFSAASTMPALELYRAQFSPSDALAEPYVMLAVNVTLADDDERAAWIAASGVQWFLRMRTGRPGLLPTPEEAAASPMSDAEQDLVNGWTAGRVIGGPETVTRQLTDLLERTGADELMVTTNVHSHTERLRSYELLAQLALPGRQ